jgi:uncharacterized small protein (DUF1192 family)
MRYSLAALLLIAGCSGPPAEERIAALEADRAALHADLLRQRAECQAQAIEFRGDEKIVGACLDAYRVMSEAVMQSVDDIDRRIAALRK